MSTIVVPIEAFHLFILSFFGYWFMTTMVALYKTNQKARITFGFVDRATSMLDRSLITASAFYSADQQAKALNDSLNTAHKIVDNVGSHLESAIRNVSTDVKDAKCNMTENACNAASDISRNFTDAINKKTEVPEKMLGMTYEAADNVIDKGASVVKNAAYIATINNIANHLLGYFFPNNTAPMSGIDMVISKIIPENIVDDQINPDDFKNKEATAPTPPVQTPSPSTPTPTPDSPKSITSI